MSRRLGHHRHDGSMPPSPLAEPWIRGVAANPAAPPSVLMRLLSAEGRPAWRTLCEERELPSEVVEAVIAHPQRAVRAGFARNRHVDPAQRGSVIGHTADQIGHVGEWINPPSADWLTACAVSEHPLLRRISATWRRAGALNRQPPTQATEWVMVPV
jgi:hypothetical protein